MAHPRSGIQMGLCEGSGVLKAVVGGGESSSHLPAILLCSEGLSEEQLWGKFVIYIYKCILYDGQELGKNTTGNLSDIWGRSLLID